MQTRTCQQSECLHGASVFEVCILWITYTVKQTKILSYLCWGRESEFDNCLCWSAPRLISWNVLQCDKHTVRTNVSKHAFIRSLRLLTEVWVFLVAKGYLYALERYRYILTVRSITWLLFFLKKAKTHRTPEMTCAVQEYFSPPLSGGVRRIIIERSSQSAIILWKISTQEKNAPFKIFP